MAFRKRRPQVFQIEALEERLTLSSVSGQTHELLPQILAERSIEARRQKLTAKFQSTGQAIPTSIIDNPDGSLTVTASITGSAKATGKTNALSRAFGNYTGTITGKVGSLTTTTVIQFRKGSQNISLTSHGTLVTQGSDSGTFVITGGTGAFANATGGGTFTASVSGAGGPNPSLTFQFTGKATVIK